VRTHAATIPFLNQELADPRVRTVLNSYDVAGGRHTLLIAYNTEKWRRDNPKTYAAVAAGLEEGMAIIARDKRAAAELYLRFEKPKLSLDQIHKILIDEALIHFSAAPSRVMVWAEFMHKNGTLSALPASWKEFFWENLHDKSGS
jgi:NitT/TauT family transport system substrate-binding protein